VTWSVEVDAGVGGRIHVHNRWEAPHIIVTMTTVTSSSSSGTGLDVGRDGGGGSVAVWRRRAVIGQLDGADDGVRAAGVALMM